MPLFFILSGMVTNPDTPGRIIKSAKRLLLPTLSWNLVHFFARGFYKQASASKYILNFLIRPDSGLWFLWVMFFVIALFVLAKKAEKHIGIASYPLIAIFLYVLPVNRYGLDLIKYYLPYLLLGYLYARYKSSWEAKWNIMFVCSLLLYVVMFTSWHRSAAQAGIDKTNLLHAGVGLITFIWIRYIEGLAGNILVIHTLRVVGKRLNMRILESFGRQSLEIYVCHLTFLELVQVQGAWAIIGVAIAAVMISLVVANSLGRVKYLDVILFGRERLIRHEAIVPLRNM